MHTCNDLELNTDISSLSIIVPVYNSATSLDDLVERIKPVISRFDKYELILINDGSVDNSWDMIERIAGKYEWVLGINLVRNYGQHNALLCGIREAHYDFIVTMDDDLQQPPEAIPAILGKLAEGYHVVYGSPQKVQQTIWRGLTSQMLRYILSTFLGRNIARDVSPFRAFRSSLRDGFSKFHNPSVSIDVLLTWSATRFTSISIPYAPRRVGRSTYSFRKLVAHSVDMLTGFSTLPLRLATLLGFVFTLFGFCALVYVIGSYFIVKGSAPGFPFIASIISVFSGATLFALGVIGEYLARVYLSILGRPPYVIRNMVGKGGDSFQDND
jgi:glycosyltransferase involved in cell wall biosynthesis